VVRGKPPAVSGEPPQLNFAGFDHSSQSIAERIVEKHGGALQYQTEVNRGTTFGIVLPRVEKDADEVETENLAH
jgi:hypothetical protein